MCPPYYYGIQYEINAWMNRNPQADHGIALLQWSQLAQVLEDAGATIELLPPHDGLPDYVFTANAGLVFRNRIVLSYSCSEQRRDEQSYTRQWFEKRGFQVADLPQDLFFEGAGDALFCGDTLFIGYRVQSEAHIHQLLAEMLNCQVIPLELTDPYYYHLDTCFCPLRTDLALYYPDAFDDRGLQVLQEAVPNLIAIPTEEAQRFAANSVVVGNTVVTNNGCPTVHQRLAEAGFKTQETDLSEFVKAGGGAKCLTLRLDGEEAAGWTQS